MKQIAHFAVGPFTSDNKIKPVINKYTPSATVPFLALYRAFIWLMPNS